MTINILTGISIILTITVMLTEVIQKVDKGFK